MEEIIVGKSTRPILVYDFFAVILENNILARLGKRRQEEGLTSEILKPYVRSLLKGNNLNATEDARNLKPEQIEAIQFDCIEEIFTDLVNEKDRQPFTEGFISEAYNLSGLIHRFDEGKHLEAASEKKEIALILRLCYEIYRRVMEEAESKGDPKRYLLGLKIVSGLNIPTNTLEYQNMAQSHHVLISIEKALERLPLPQIINPAEMFKYYIYFPNFEELKKDIKSLVNMGLPVPETESRIADFYGQYYSFDVVETFTAPVYSRDILWLLCPNDLYRPTIKRILDFLHADIGSRKKAFKKFIDQQIKELKIKVLDFGENVLGVIGFFIVMLDENKDGQFIVGHMSKVFVKTYQNIVNNLHLDIDEKMDQLKELVDRKKEYCSSNMVNTLKEEYQDLVSQKIDHHKLFFENHYQKKPVKYLFLIYRAYKTNNITFMQEVIHAEDENRLLRNYSRDLLFKKLGELDNITSMEKIRSIKATYRGYFKLMTSEKESFDYQREILLYLLKTMTETQTFPYEHFLMDMSDVFLAEIRKVLDLDVFNKKVGGKHLRRGDEAKIALSSFFIEGEYYNKLKEDLERQGPSKEEIKRKIELRFGNEYKTIEDKFYKLRKKLI
ncbi:MAG: hypothetical protein IEMM0008_1301 [bacterium]|nr:MAG: hypothetical protein IEMM0008_1301 [bacterium]